ncbi:hypothetical protein [Winogradskyella forsetii]|uniref:hypothetical protein n=1 Tax=Winogradskyella forsetii TaxID=2686077 RepID=UPI0015BEFD42|nr:hypothetical protein [Winogradskyella forsetii]
MFDNISYKKKFFILILVGVLLSISAYKRSFSLTIDSYKESKSLNERLNYINSASNDVSALDKEIKFLNNLIGEESIEPELVQQEILNFVTNNHNRVSVDNIEEVHNAKDNDFIIYSNQLTLEGSFRDLLEVIYNFEKKFTYSRLVNVTFFIKKDFKTRTEKLYSKIIFQNYEKDIQSR